MNIQMTDLTPVNSEAAWRGDVIRDRTDWIYQLSDEELTELEALGTRFVEEDPDLRTVRAADYPLMACADAVQAWGHDVDFGRGFVLVRGLRPYLYSDALSAAIYYILGLHMGEPIRQGAKDLIGHVYATSTKTMADPTAKSARVSDELVYHSDSSDIVALMCLRGAKSGGTSCLVSGAQIYNEILARRPDLAPLLLQPFHWDWKRQDSKAPENTYVSPIVSIKEGVFSMYAGSTYILSAAEDYDEVPDLTPEQIEVIALFDQIAYEEGMAIEMDFRPGDIQWLSNYAALHARTRFDDYPEAQRKRHLLRLWLSRETGRPLVEGFGKNAKVIPRTVPAGVAEEMEHAFSVRTAAVPLHID